MAVWVLHAVVARIRPFGVGNGLFFSFAMIHRIVMVGCVFCESGGFQSYLRGLLP